MQPEIVYVVSESLKSVTQAAGFTGKGAEVPLCPLHVGDVISAPVAPGLFFRVTARWFAEGGPSKPARWFVMLEQASDPLAQLDTLPSPR